MSFLSRFSGSLAVCDSVVEQRGALLEREEVAEEAVMMQPRDSGRGHCGNILGAKTRILNLSSWQVTELEMQWQCCQHIAISIVRTFLPMEQ